MLRCSILVFFFFFSYLLFAQQTYERTLSVSEWINEMERCKDEKYILQNAKIIDDKRDIKAKIESNYTNIDAVVILRNCKIEGNGFIVFPKLNFRKGLYIISSSAPGIYFTKCKFGFFGTWECSFKLLSIHESTIYDQLIFIRSDFGIQLSLNNISLIDSTPQFDYWVNGKVNDLDFFEFNQSKADKIEFLECKFMVTDSNDNSDFVNNSVEIIGEIENLRLSNSIFSVPLKFSNGSITNYFSVNNCRFSHLLFNHFNIPEIGTNCHWSMVSDNKIGVINTDKHHLEITDSLLTDNYFYPELISVYQKFFSAYKKRGDLESANGCYVEMKEIETKRMAYTYQIEKNMKNYTNWKLNQFLKTFCNYGTSPVKSLIISFYVVLAFACFYFFFYTDWDRINRSFLMRKYNTLLTYFRSEQKLEDFYTEQHKEEFQSYEEFKENLQESKIEVPLFINLLGKPLYHLSLAHHSVNQWMYRRSEILSGRWTDLGRGRRMYVSSVTGIIILFYLAYLVFIRSINSLFLSINTFSTLGFGDIPVKGISRYMAILEGFLGWFLLSIFSVSLISQILQN